MKQVFFIAAICFTLLFGCKEKATESSQSVKEFAIYLLRDSTVTVSAASNRPLDSLVLAPKPLITQNDLQSYTWSTHTFTVQPAIDTLLKQMSVLGGKSSGVPFVVTVDNERIYLGALWWVYSSSISQVSYMYVSPISPHQIKHDSTSSKPDLRNDQRIHDALKAAGVFVE
jgi:hypothetical protein